jgi:hypothetical protein
MLENLHWFPLLKLFLVEKVNKLIITHDDTNFFERNHMKNEKTMKIVIYMKKKVDNYN